MDIPKPTEAAQSYAFSMWLESVQEGSPLREDVVGALALGYDEGFKAGADYVYKKVEAEVTRLEAELEP